MADATPGSIARASRFRLRRCAGPAAAACARTGVRSSAILCKTRRPPIMAMPSGRGSPEPSPRPMASGTAARIAPSSSSRSGRSARCWLRAAPVRACAVPPGDADHRGRVLPDAAGRQRQRDRRDRRPPGIEGEQRQQRSHAGSRSRRQEGRRVHQAPAAPAPHPAGGDDRGKCGAGPRRGRIDGLHSRASRIRRSFRWPARP